MKSNTLTLSMLVDLKKEARSDLSHVQGAALIPQFYDQPNSSGVSTLCHVLIRPEPLPQ
jgi:hypothetical protein